MLYYSNSYSFTFFLWFPFLHLLFWFSSNHFFIFCFSFHHFIILILIPSFYYSESDSHFFSGRISCLFLFSLYYLSNLIMHKFNLFFFVVVVLETEKWQYWVFNSFLINHKNITIWFFKFFFLFSPLYCLYLKIDFY